MSAIRWNFRLNEIEDEGSSKFKYRISADYHGRKAGCKKFTEVYPHEIVSLWENTKKDERNFYEIIHRDSKIKPYFDFDCDTEKVSRRAIISSINLVVSKILEKTEAKGITKKNIMIFETQNPSKYSFHIVVDGIFVRGVEECRTFCTEAINLTDSKFIINDFFDSSVYTHNRSFRIIYCSKLGKKYTKEFSELSEWKPILKFDPKEFEKHELFSEFFSSLVTYTHYCENFEVKIAPKKTYTATDSTLFLEHLKAEDIVDKFAKYYKNKGHDFPFVIQDVDVEKNIIMLQRKRPSFCITCDRVHAAENPYIYIYKHAKTEGKVNISFSCRRSDKKLVKSI